MDIYLDYAATTPLDPAVLDAMIPALRGLHGNPSSVHRLGQRARSDVERAREEVAAAVGARAKDVIFTSGATEADNHALRAAAAARPGKRIVTALTEHAAVLATAEALAASGTPVTFLTPAPDGSIPLDRVANVLDDDVGLIALMWVNNETGVMNDIPAIAELARGVGAWTFTDAVQAFGAQPVDIGKLGVDMLSISAHKAYGPKGMGALVLREGFELAPMLLGGSQERGLRPGTQNTPGIVGFGEAARLVRSRVAGDQQRIATLRDRLETALVQIPGAEINGTGAERGPKHCNVTFEGTDGETVLMALDAAGIAASAGSACAAGSIEPSHVLLAMGLDRRAAKSSLRFSLGRGLDEPTIDAAAAAIAAAVERSRAIGA